METLSLSKMHSVLILLCLLLIFTHPSHPHPHPTAEDGVHRRTLLPGGISNVPNFQTDPDVQQAARFAVQEYSRQQKLTHVLVLWEVLSAKFQVVAGKMYYLTLLARSGGKNQKYDAKVWVKPRKQNNMSLEEFKRVSS